jgi:hypothetical protein
VAQSGTAQAWKIVFPKKQLRELVSARISRFKSGRWRHFLIANQKKFKLNSKNNNQANVA